MRTNFILSQIAAALCCLTFLGCQSASPSNPYSLSEAPGNRSLSLRFHSNGQAFNLNWVPLPEVSYLRLIGDELHFDNDILKFVCLTGGDYLFRSTKSLSFVRFSLDSKGLISLLETSNLSGRPWESTAGQKQFTEWANAFSELGYNANRVGFFPSSKFVDGTYTELKSGEMGIIDVSINGSAVSWAGSLVNPSIVVMRDESIAVQLVNENRSLWIYGGGGFQLNITDDIKTTYVGKSEVPSGFGSVTKVPDPFPAIYVSLKKLALARTKTDSSTISQ